MSKSAVAVGLVIGLLAPRPVDACINPMRLAKDKGVQMLVRAQAQLDAGASAEALATIDPEGAMRTGATLSYSTGDEALQARARLVALTALVRSGSAEEQLHARELLEVMLRRDPGHPLLVARMAEALAGGDAAQRKQALTMLARLAERDLLPDAEAAAVLARLANAAGDRAGAARASERCAQLASRDGVCEVAAPAAPRAAGRSRPVPAS